MLGKIKAFIKWLQSFEPAWMTKSTWINEGLSGVFYIPLAIWLGPYWALLIYTTGSYGYERWLDPWGWDDLDFAQREIAALLLTLLWTVL